MDIKLKNNHKIRGFVIALVILLPALIMVGLYPYFQKQAEQVQRQPQYTEYGNLAELVEGSYVAYVKKLEQEEGQILQPAEVFMPGIVPEQTRGDNGAGPAFTITTEEDTAVSARVMAIEGMEPEDMEDFYDSYETDSYYKRNLYDRFLNKYAGWERIYNSRSQYVSYDTDGTEAAGNSTKAGEDGMSFTIRYDSNGNASLDDLTVPYSEYLELARSNLQQILRDDPMSDDYEDEYRYLVAWTFHKPRDFTVTCYVAPDFWMLDKQEVNGGTYYQSGEVILAAVILMMATGLAALLLPFVRGLNVGNKRMFRIPAEVVCFGAWLTVVLMVGLVNLVAVTNGGELHAELLKMNLLPISADILGALLNILCWTVVFAGTYWAVTCFRAVFTIGFGTYLKKRTWTGRVLSWCWRVIRKGVQSLGDIDLRDNTNRCLLKIVAANFAVVSFLCFFWFYGIGAVLLYSVILYIVLHKYFGNLKTKYGILLKATNELAEGNLDVTIEEELGVFEPLKEELTKIQHGFKKAVDEEVKSQRMKTDLVTNVSHDLKTPLTAIITYVNLLKEEGVTEEERKSYIEVLEQKSMRLKVLIEDLFEISKATSKNVTLNLVDVDIVSLMKQVGLELEDKIQASGVNFRWDLPDEKVMINLDSQKTYRVFENLIVNITKYAMPGTRAYIGIQVQNGEAVISMKNTSASELNFSPEEITDRFVRGDVSRNTEGSGLGLAIAKSFTELQKGRFFIDVEADLFKVEIRWRCEEKEDTEI